MSRVNLFVNTVHCIVVPNVTNLKNVYINVYSTLVKFECQKNGKKLLRIKKVIESTIGVCTVAIYNNNA